MLFRLSWDYLKVRWLQVAIVFVLQLVQSIASLLLPSLNADIIDEGVVVGDIGRIWELGIIMLVVTVVQAVATAGAVFVGVRLAMGLGHELRARSFRTVQSFGRAELHEFGPASLITRSTNDVTQIQMVVHMTLTFMLMAPIVGVGGIIMAIRQDATLSLLFLVIVPVLGLFMAIMMIKLGPLYEVQQKRIDAINRILREQLTGARVIRAFLRQGTEERRFQGANDDMRDIWLKIGTMWAFMMPVVQLIVGLSSVAIVWFGGHRIDSGDMEVGSLIAFINYLMQIFMSVMIASMMFMMVPRARVSARRIAAVLDTEPAIAAPANPKQIPPHPHVFTFDDVTIQYPGADAPVLTGLSFELRPGTTTAIVGATGSGKSTVVGMLPRMLDPTGGTVRLNGIDLREFDPKAVRESIALIPQKAYLFSGTIASTITGQRDPDAPVDEDRVWAALRAAQASDFVSELKEGLKTEVDPGGRNFSGGQRQRLTIARALYRAMAEDGADLVIFDDSFSALDFATDSRLRAGLPDAIPGAAVLIVAQRISTIRHADEIIVLDNGRAVGQGTHAELMATCTEYQEIVASQLSAEEAA